MAWDGKWRQATWDLFGYRLLGEHNMEEISGALEKIWELLDDLREVQITVRERVEDADVIEGRAIGAIRLPASE